MLSFAHDELLQTEQGMALDFGMVAMDDALMRADGWYIDARLHESYKLSQHSIDIQPKSCQLISFISKKYPAALP
jgi:hypothetical protein